MTLRGFIMAADLEETPPESGRVEMTLRLQGVGPGQPRRVVIPFAMLLADPSLDPDDLVGRGFEADADQVGPARWEVVRLGLAAKVLRPKSP